METSISDMWFYYSAPTSPSRRIKLSALSGYQTGSTTPRTQHDEDYCANSNLGEFEFETSRRFNVELEDNEPSYDHDQMQEPCLDSVPTMAFADELFSEGKVLPLMPQLKLPPRMVQSNDGSMKSAQSSTLTSPRSPGLAAIRLPFSRHSLWNDDFDPFMVALEKVKEEKRENSKAKNSNNGNGLRRTRSLSPFREFNSHRSVKHVKQDESYSCGTSKVICEFQKEPSLKQSSRKPDMLSESKGLVIAKFEPKKISISKPDMDTNKEESKKGGSFWTRKKKTEKNIVKFLFGNAYLRKDSSQHKLDDKKSALEKPVMSKNMMSSSQSTQDGRKGDMNRMSLVCHKPRGPRILLCLGHDGGYVK